MWNNHELEYLRKKAGILPTKEIAKNLNKSHANVRKQASNENLSLFISKIPKEKIELANQMIKAGKNAAAIVRKTGLSHCYIHNLKFKKIKHLNKSKKKVDEEKIRQTLNSIFV